MEVKLIHITENAEDLIERTGRICYNSKMGQDNSIIKKWIKSGHESIIEHASATFEISGVSRALTHQLVRHRLASYTQQSQRYVSSSNFEYVTPTSVAIDPHLRIKYENIMRAINSCYNDLIENGIKKEDARFLLPNATTTKITTTMNFRELRNFLKLRLDKHAQWEIRQLATKMLGKVFSHAPFVFSDIMEAQNED